MTFNSQENARLGPRHQRKVTAKHTLTVHDYDRMANALGVLFGLLLGMVVHGQVGVWYKQSTPLDVWVQMYYNSSFQVITLLSVAGALALCIPVGIFLTNAAWTVIKRYSQSQDDSIA